jgi:hypothetical protein
MWWLLLRTGFVSATSGGGFVLDGESDEGWG